MNSLRSPVISGLFVFLAGCTWNSGRVANQPVIQVNNQILTAKNFGVLLARRLKDFDSLNAKDPNNVSRVKEAIIRNFLLQTLVEEYSKKNDVVLADSDLEKEINTIRSSYPDDLSFRRVLAEENLSLAEWKEELRKSLLERKVFKKIAEKIIPPKPEELRRAYEESKDKFRHKERILLRQIIVDELGKAEAIHEELKKKDFSALAKKYSVSPEGKNGGLVGLIERGTVDIFDKAFSLSVNTVSQVLESPYGFHIFKVERKEPPGIDGLEQVKERLYQQILAQKEQAEFSAWLDKQIRSNRVLRDNDLISSITVETKGENQ